MVETLLRRSAGLAHVARAILVAADGTTATADAATATADAAATHAATVSGTIEATEQDAAALAEPAASYLVEAAEVLLGCRSTLRWTYAFAYFLPEGKEREMFDYLQAEVWNTAPPPSPSPLLPTPPNSTRSLSNSST